MSKRCAWADSTPLMTRYHDTEWGVPVHDDRTLFEFLTLEGAQAGLSWNTILNKRENYRAEFANFDPRKVARYDKRKIAALMLDPGIVRNRVHGQQCARTYCGAAAIWLVRPIYLAVRRRQTQAQPLAPFAPGSGFNHSVR